VDKAEKIKARVVSGQSDYNLRFADVVTLLLALGFSLRVKGSHHIFTKPDDPCFFNLQPGHNGKAKPYEVRQIRQAIKKYSL
jgi:predicted RNA binding protein YcfA (HicA-like mRNA interferase family)